MPWSRTTKNGARRSAQTGCREKKQIPPLRDDDGDLTPHTNTVISTERGARAENLLLLCAEGTSNRAPCDNNRSRLLRDDEVGKRSTKIHPMPGAPYIAFFAMCGLCAQRILLVFLQRSLLESTLNQKSPDRSPGSRNAEQTYAWDSSATIFAWATVNAGSPTLKRAKRRTEIFSPSLAILVAMICFTDWPCSLMKGCSSRQTSS